VGWNTNPASRRTLYNYRDGNNVLCKYLHQPGAMTVARQYVNGHTYLDESVEGLPGPPKQIQRDLKSTGQDHYYLLKDANFTAPTPDPGSPPGDRYCVSRIQYGVPRTQFWRKRQ
jgi:hypothetical protein